MECMSVCFNNSCLSHSSHSFQSRLETICFGLRETLNSIEGRLKAEHFKQRVLNVFRVWEEWAVYPSDLLVSLQYIFLGLITKVSRSQVSGSHFYSFLSFSLSIQDKDGSRGGGGGDNSDDVDGIPLEDMDGLPLDDHDVDPVTGDACSSAKRMKFKPSKWETVD